MRTLPLLLTLLALPALAAEPPTFPVSFTTTRPGKVSVNVFTAQGKLVHQLAVGLPMDPGPHTLQWDGCDDAGRPVAPGAYSVRGLCADLRSVWDGKVCNTSPSPGDDSLQYRTGQYTDVFALPDGGLLTCSAWGERARMCQRLGVPPDYPVTWSTQVVDYWGPSVSCTFGLACAADDEHLYVISAKLHKPDPQGLEGLSRWRLKDGVRVPFKTGGPGDEFGVLLLSEPRGPLGWNWGLAPGRDPFEGLDAVGLTYKHGLLYVARQLANRIDRLDPKTGQVVGSLEVSRPRRLAWDAAGENLYVTTPRQLLRFGRNDTQGQVLASGFSLATGVAVGPTGDLYVTDLGASQQLKVFSPEGKLLRTFGVKGGHQGGRIAPDLLDNPLGVSVGPDGAIYLADYGGERILALNPDFTVRKQIYGTMTYCMSLSELDPSLVYRWWPRQDLWEYRVDYRTGQAVQTRRWRYDRCGLSLDWRLDSAKVQFRRWKGRTFAIWAGHGVIAEMDGDRLLPRVILSTGALPKIVVDDNPPSLPERGGQGGESDPGPWVWRDRNLDGRLQLSEFEFGTWNHAWNYHDGQMDAAGNLYIPQLWTNYRDPVLMPAGILTVPFEGLDEQGLPRYHWKSAQWIIRIAGTGIPHKDMAGVEVEYVVGRDGVNYIPNPGTCALDREGNYLVTDAGDIFSNPNRPLSLRKYSPTGELLWQVGQRQWHARRKPGDISFAGFFSGDIDQRYFFYIDYDGTMNGWDADGLWLGRLFADLPREVQNLGECFHGWIFRHPNGRIYAYSSPDCTYRMSRIIVEGLDKIEHFSGTVTVDQTPPPRPPAVTEQPPWRVLRVRGPIQIDGIIGPTEWGTNTDTQAPVHFYVDDHPWALSWAQWDNDALYLAWQIWDSTPAVNMSRGEMKWSGDQVEFMIRAQPDLLGASGPGGHSATEYQLAIGPDADGKLSAFVQMNGSDKQGKDLPGVEIGLQVRPDKSAYTMEARIPWASLGDWRPQAGDQVKWNMIIDWGTRDGTAWDHHAKFAAGLHTAPANWGTAVFE